MNLDYHIVSNQRTKQSFTYDYVFAEDSTNAQVFENLALPLIQSALAGINCTIFAYGQTSSGKTYTIQGNSQNPGLIAQGIDYIFDYIRNTQRNFLIKISYLEVYNEQVNDLLDTSKTNLEIRERPDKGIYVEKLSEITVENEQKAYELLAVGESNRKIGETNMNSQSSRSHTIFKVYIESSDDYCALASQMNFVDLAGSEGVQKTKAEDIRLREGSNINKSLLSLSSVIQKLSQSKGGKNYINFRDSKMTRLLQPALSGNSKTAVICNVSPDINYYQETLNTLLFGSKTKRIKTDAKMNEIIINEEQIKNVNEENKRLYEKCQELEVSLSQSVEAFNKIVDEKNNCESRFNACVKEHADQNLKISEENFRLQKMMNDKENEILKIQIDLDQLKKKNNEICCRLADEKNEKFDVLNANLELNTLVNEKNKEICENQKIINSLERTIFDVNENMGSVIEIKANIEKEN